jgi:hypothetical protein
MRRFVHDLGLSGLLAAAVLATGCPDRPVAAIDPNPVKQNGSLIPVNTGRNLDILFVIDNSGSMEGEQNSLKAAFPTFMGVLKGIEGGLPNVHIGVVSSNVGIGDFSAEGAESCQRPTRNGDNGALQNSIYTRESQVQGTCADLQGKFIIDEVQGEDRVRNYSEAIGLENTFTCMASLGIGGCGFEQHLESMKRALENASGQNNGFLRDNAYLAIIFLADEDDCSAANNAVFDPSDSSFNGTLGPMESFRCTEFGIACNGQPIDRAAGSYTGCSPREDQPYMRHPDEYADWLKTVVKPGNQNLLIVSTIIGNPDPVQTELVNTDNGQVVRLRQSCQEGGNSAAPGVRLNYFREQFTNNSFTSICQGNLEAGLEQVARLLARVIGDRCIQGNISQADLDDNQPGLQLECTVEEVTNPNTEDETSKTIRRCEMQDANNPAEGQKLPCWYVVSDNACTGETKLKFDVKREGDGDAPEGTFERIACVGE